MLRFGIKEKTTYVQFRPNLCYFLSDFSQVKIAMDQVSFWLKELTLTVWVWAFVCLSWISCKSCDIGWLSIRALRENPPKALRGYSNDTILLVDFPRTALVESQPKGMPDA